MRQNDKPGFDLDRVRAAIEPLLSTHGVALVELVWTTERVGWTLRLTIERVGSTDDTGDVTLEDCVEVSRDVSSVLDVEDIIPHRYSLEVSSPGLERPLRTAADFARFVGRLVRIKLARPAADGQRVLRGLLEEFRADTIAVRADQKRFEVPLANVEEANLVFELDRQPKGAAKPAPSKAKRLA